VVVITLPNYDVTKVIFYPDYMRFLFVGNGLHTGNIVVSYKDIYGILAAPPCPMFSFARNDKRARAPRDLEKGLITVDACLRIVRCCQLRGSLKFWALENPVGYLRLFLGMPFWTFSAWMYGDPWKKMTDLWGLFNVPDVNIYRGNLKSINMKYRCTSRDKISPNCTDEYFEKVKGERRIIRRSITPPGFAAAFFKANK
jgi:hypothetical protein